MRRAVQRHHARGLLRTRSLPSLLLACLVALVCVGVPSAAPCRAYADSGELVEVWYTDVNDDQLDGEVDINVLQQGMYQYSIFTSGGVAQGCTVYDNDTGNEVSTYPHSVSDSSSFALSVVFYTFEELLVVGHSYTIEYCWYQFTNGQPDRSTSRYVYFTFTVGGSSGGDDEDDGGGAAEGLQDDGGGASDGSQDDGGQGGAQDAPDPDPAPAEEDAEAGGSQYQDDGGQGGAQDAPDPDPAPAEDGDGRGDLDDAVVSGALGGVGDATGGAGGSSGGGSSGGGDAGTAMGNSNEEASAEADSDARGASSSPSGGLAPERPTIGRRAESAVRASDPASEPSRASVASSVIGDVVSGSDMEEFRGRGDDLYELAVGAVASPEAASAGGSAGGSAGAGGAGGGGAGGSGGSDRDASPMSPAGLSEEASEASGDEEPASPGDVYTVGAPARADFTATGLSYVWAAVWALVAAAAALGVLRRPVAARLGRTRRSRLSGAPAALWSQPSSEVRHSISG